MLTFLPDTDIRSIVNIFFPTQSVRISSVAKGLLNQNMLVETESERYILKVYRSELTRDALEEMHRVIGFLKERHFPVPVLIGFHEYHGMQVGLYSYLPGKNPCLYSNPLPRVVAMGEMLGRIHQALAEYASIYNFKNASPEPLVKSVQKSLETVKGLQERSMHEQPAHAEQLSLFLKRHTERIEAETWDISVFDLLPHHVCHGDFHTKNMLFQAETITGVLDWEKFGWGCHGLEVVRSLVFNCRRNASSFNWQSVESYVRAYKRHVSLTEEECLYAFPLVYQRMLCGTWAEEQYLKGQTDLWDNIVRRFAFNEYLFTNKRQISRRLQSLLRDAPALT